MLSKDNILELKDLCLSTGEGFRLENINLSVPRNSIFTILGSNMSGKTLLMKTVCGIAQPASGEIIYNSEMVHFSDEIQARRMGIYYFSYYPQIIPELSIAENIILGSEKTFGSYIFRSPRKAAAAIQRRMNEYGLSFDPEAKAGSLGFCQQHLVSFFRAALNGCRLLILDELIAHFSPSEISDLKRLLKRMTEHGVTVVCLAQYLNSFTTESDYYYPMPQTGGDKSPGSSPISASQYAESFARNHPSAANKYPHIHMVPGELLLDARNLSSAFYPGLHFDFSIRESEVIGITGNSIPYTKHMFDLLSGNAAAGTGRLRIRGCPVSFPKNRAFVKKNISYLSGEPSRNLADNLDLTDNIFLSNYRRVSRRGFLSSSKMAAQSYEYVSLLNMPNISFHSGIKQLSSGTQQKIAISKALNAGSVLYFFNTPTANLDTASSMDFYNIINSLKRHGRGIALLSYDLEELCGVCDRIYIFRENEPVLEFKNNLQTQQLIKEKLK